MKNTRWILLAALLLLVTPVLAGDGEDAEVPADESTAEITTGYQDSGTSGTLIRVAEYEVVDSTPIMGLLWRTSPYANTTFGIQVTNWKTQDNFAIGSELDVDRKIRVKAQSNQFIHRLDHDPLDNLQAVSEIKVTRRTDFNPGDDYLINNNITNILGEFQHPGAKHWTFRAGYFQMHRKGTKQQLNTSHCTSCHATSQTRDVDNKTYDVIAGVHLGVGKVDFDYQYTGRVYQDDAGGITAPYEKGYHPMASPSGSPGVGLVTPFNDRLWYQDGNFSVNNVPETRHDISQFKALATFKPGTTLNFTIVDSVSKNQSTNLQYDFQAYRGKYTMKAGKKWRFNLFAHYEKLQNDTVPIDLVSLNGLLGAPRTSYPGFADPLTFQEWRQQVDDPSLVFNEFTRFSAMNREIGRAGADATWRATRAGWLRLGYRYNSTDREYVTLANGTGKTEAHTLKVGWNQRFRNRVRLHTKLTYRQVDNPYVNVDGAWRLYQDNPDGIAPSPKSPASLQYYQLHGLRAANVSSFATEDLKVRASASWGPKNARWWFTGNVRYRDAKNDELDFTEWQQNTTGVGVNWWVAASRRFNFMVGLDSYRMETDAEAIVPLMDG